MAFPDKYAQPCFLINKSNRDKQYGIKIDNPDKLKLYTEVLCIYNWHCQMDYAPYREHFTRTSWIILNEKDEYCKKQMKQFKRWWKAFEPHLVAFAECYIAIKDIDAHWIKVFIDGITRIDTDKEYLRAIKNLEKL